MGLYRLCLECIAYLRYCTVVQVFEIYVCVVRVAVFLLKFTYIHITGYIYYIHDMYVCVVNDNVE